MGDWRTETYEMENGADNGKRSKETLNRFYTDLLSKEICLSQGETEVNDILAAVTKMVEGLAEKVGEIDERLKISDVILVGSAKEKTQIVVPCEYDFQLKLDVLSKPGVVSLVRGCPDSNCYVHVKLEDDQVLSLFEDLTHDGHIRATQDYQSYIYRKNGLRQLFWKTLQKAAIRCSRLEVKLESGYLLFKKTTIYKHGPVYAAIFKWYSHQSKKCMDVTVDLCPVVRLDGMFDKVISPENVICMTYYKYAQRKGIISLLPCMRGCACRFGLCFKIIFTEIEVLLMEKISEHHKQCYKVLKYLINGRPDLPKTEVALVPLSPGVHSYALKVLVWNHHFVNMCSEDICMASCLKMMMKEVYDILAFDISGKPRREVVHKLLPCPFDNYNSIWSTQDKCMQDEVCLPMQEALERRAGELLERLENISQMENYSFEKCRIRTLDKETNTEYAQGIAITIAGYCFAALCAVFI